MYNCEIMKILSTSLEREVDMITFFGSLAPFFAAALNRKKNSNSVRLSGTRN
jgi:hypothetical protein